MVSTAIELPQRSEPDTSLIRLPTRNVFIIVDQQSSMQRDVASRLENSLMFSTGTICHTFSLKQASNSGDLDDTFCIFLIESEQPLVMNLDESKFAMLKRVVMKAPGHLWVTNGGGRRHDQPQLHLLDGLARVCRTEYNKLMFVTLALENTHSFNETHRGSHFRQISRVLGEIKAQSPDDFESEYTEKNGMLEIGRVVEAIDLNHEVYAKTRSHQRKMQEFGKGPPLELHIESPGSLDSLQFLEAVSTRQAEFQVAGYLGAEIYVTIGSDSKKKLLMDLFSIPEDHMFYSRNTSFAQGILRMTADRGVDVVLNSLSGEGLRASWECVAPVRIVSSKSNLLLIYFPAGSLCRNWETRYQCPWQSPNVAIPQECDFLIP